MFCQKCGKELIEGSVFCPSCGNPVQIQGDITNAASTVPSNITNKTTAIKRSKPWYKRWWIWAIAAAVLFILLASLGSCDVDSGGGVIIKTVDSGSSSQPKASTAPKNQYPDEILYNGVPISQIFQTQAQDIRSLLGEPTHVEDGENASYCYGTIEGTDGSEIWLNYNQQGHLNEINAYGLSKFTFNGASLAGKNRAGVIEMLGKPDGESDPENNSRAEYFMNWQYEGYSVKMLTQSTNPEEVPFSTTFTNKDWIPDTYVDTSNMIDENFEWVEQPTMHINYIGSGLDQMRMGGTISGIIKNTTGKTFSSVSISFTLYDSAGNQVGTAFDRIDNLAGGNTWKFEALAVEDSATKFSFNGINAY